jgi:hypothetical protein
MFAETDFPDAINPWSCGVVSKPSVRWWSRAARNSKKGRGAVRWSPLLGRETLCKLEAHGRYSREIKREGLRAE